MAYTLLVSGASGHLGRRVIAHLLESHRVPPAQIVAGTRRPDQLASLAEAGVSVRRLDFEDPSSLTSALRNVDRMLLISTDAVDRPGARLNQHRAAVEAASAASVKHIVYTSMPNPGESFITFAPDHLGTEDALRSSGLAWTILRMNWYMENLLPSLRLALAAGKWHTASGKGRVGYISREDCARAAAAALYAPTRTSTWFDITGPELLSAAQVVAMVRDLVRAPLEIVEQTEMEYRFGLKGAGLADPVIAVLVSIEASIRTGKLQVATHDVKTLTGKPPKRLWEFLMEHKATLTAGLATRRTARDQS